MELTFQKSADRWIAEFEAHADFNLHLEGVLGGSVSIFQRGTDSGGYAYVNDATPIPSYANVYDYDFTSLVYPKFIKVSCATEPTFAAVTTDGEITEIKSQSKEVEVTANGTMDITPDAGFSYLNSVKVNTNVPTSGEGGGSSNYIYYDQKRTILNARSEWENAILLRAEVMGYVIIGTPLSIYTMIEGSGVDLESSIVAVCLDPNLRIVNPEFNGTLEEFIGSSNISHLRDEISITEEEFYNLNA